MKKFVYTLIVSSLLLFTGCSDDTDGTSSAIDTITNTDMALPPPHTMKFLKKTGQTEVIYANDDGDLQRGEDINYTRDAQNEVVIDGVTNLMWEDSYADTTYYLWSEAFTRCEEFGLNGYDDWRVPTIDELVFIIDRGREEPALNPAFQHKLYASDDHYWSSTENPKDNDYAWVISFRTGIYEESEKDYGLSVVCVRDISEK